MIACVIENGVINTLIFSSALHAILSTNDRLDAASTQLHGVVACVYNWLKNTKLTNHEKQNSDKVPVSKITVDWDSC